MLCYSSRLLNIHCDVVVDGEEDVVDGEIVNGEEIIDLFNITSVTYPEYVELNEVVVISGTFQYYLSTLTGVSVRFYEADPLSLYPEESLLAYQDLALQGEGVEIFNFSTTAPESEGEWNLVVTLWRLGVTEWELQDQYAFSITIVYYQPEVEIISFGISDLEPTEGDTITITVKFSVTGFTPDQKLRIKFLVDDETIQEDSVILPAEEIFVHTSYIEWEAVEGDHTITVAVDSTEEEIELTVEETPSPPPSPPSEIPPWFWIGSIAVIATAGLLLIPRLTYGKALTCETGYKWMFQEMRLITYPRGFGELRTLADDPLPLRARSWDRHVLIQECTCGESVGTKNIILEANKKFEWEIIGGEGGFIKINDGTLSKKAVGEQVLYQPPEIDDPKEKKKVTFKISAHHDDDTKPPKHDPCVVTWTLEIQRDIREKGRSTENAKEFTDPGEVIDEYVYTQKSLEEKCPKYQIRPKEKKGECLPRHSWSAEKPIDGEVVSAPKEVATGDYVVLQATGTDTDKIHLKCQHGGEICTAGSEKELVLNDVLSYRWESSKGKFPLRRYGREVVWQAPKEEGKVKIKLEIFDTPLSTYRQFDDEKTKKVEIEIEVCKLGIDLVKTPKTWNTTSNLKLSDLTLQPPARIYICKNKKWVYPGRKKLIRLKLKKVSREKGVCMNYPKNGNTNPDLFFYEEKMKDDHLFFRDKTVSKDCPIEVVATNDNPSHDRHYLYSVLKHKKSEASPVIRCEDYGAIGFLEAEANHCVKIPPRETVKEEPCIKNPGCCSGSNQVKIPLDDDDNDIADGAQQNEAGKAANKDEDTTPTGEGTKGDGLTNYEEYRGFIVGGQKTVTIKVPSFDITILTAKLVDVNITRGTPKKHVRTDTTKKDVFVFDQNFLGTGYLNQSGFTIHKFFDADLFNGTGNRVINFNRGRNSGGEQHGLWLRNQALGGAQGRACGGANGPPKNKTHICVDVATCTALGEPASTLSCVIAHELGHGLNVWHHGETGNHNCGGKSRNRAGGLTSGRHDCVMRYDQYAYGWCHGTPHCKHNYPGDKPGDIFCSSKSGTGFNNAGAGHRNDATRGDCKGQLKVKDW